MKTFGATEIIQYKLRYDRGGVNRDVYLGKKRKAIFYYKNNFKKKHRNRNVDSFSFLIFKVSLLVIAFFVLIKIDVALSNGYFLQEENNRYFATVEFDKNYATEDKPYKSLNDLDENLLREYKKLDEIYNEVDAHVYKNFIYAEKTTDEHSYADYTRKPKADYTEKMDDSVGLFVNKKTSIKKYGSEPMDRYVQNTIEICDYAEKATSSKLKYETYKDKKYLDESKIYLEKYLKSVKKRTAIANSVLEKIGYSELERQKILSTIDQDIDNVYFNYGLH